jgi:fatty acid amide hydrolase 2
VLLMPTYQGVAPRRQWPLLSRQAFAYTVLFNLFGFPVTQVPLGLSREGLPLGVQLVAAPGKDHLTLALAMELEHKFGGWVPPWNIERQQEVSVA